VHQAPLAPDDHADAAPPVVLSCSMLWPPLAVLPPPAPAPVHCFPCCYAQPLPQLL
jgi:hypothetical protein